MPLLGPCLCSDDAPARRCPCHQDLNLAPSPLAPVASLLWERQEDTGTLRRRYSRQKLQPLPQQRSVAPRWLVAQSRQCTRNIGTATCAIAGIVARRQARLKRRKSVGLLEFEVVAVGASREEVEDGSGIQSRIVESFSHAISPIMEVIVDVLPRSLLSPPLALCSHRHRVVLWAGTNICLCCDSITQRGNSQRGKWLHHHRARSDCSRNWPI